jgi:hypothetical protein
MLYLSCVYPLPSHRGLLFVVFLSLASKCGMTLVVHQKPLPPEPSACKLFKITSLVVEK